MKLKATFHYSELAVLGMGLLQLYIIKSPSSTGLL